MLTASAAQALSILRDTSHFQWYLIPLFALVVYVYAVEVERRNWNLVFAGLAFWGWGAVSTVFYLWLLKVAYDVISEAKVNQPKVAGALNAVWILFLVSWTIYPVAYLMPVISETAGGVVARQLIYSFADIFSKAVYGVMLGYIAQKLSAVRGYQPAIEAEEAFAEQTG